MKLEELEKIRLECSKKVTAGLVLLIAGFLTLFIFPTLMENAGKSPVVVIIVGFACILVGVLLMSPAMIKFKKLEKNFKQQFIVPIIETIYPDCKFNPGLGVSEKFAISSGIIPRGDRYHSEDLIEGEYSDVKFLTADVKVEEEHTRTDSDGHVETYYETIFMGRFFEFEFNKKFKSNVIVTEDSGNISRGGMNKVKLESIEFNKKFKTFAQSDLEAFYILTPQIMERLMDIEAKNPGRCSFSFINNKFYFALNNNSDTFSVALYKKIDESMFDIYKTEANLMKDIINTLKLNVKIFTEED